MSHEIEESKHVSKKQHAALNERVTPDFRKFVRQASGVNGEKNLIVKSQPHGIKHRGMQRNDYFFQEPINSQ